MITYNLTEEELTKGVQVLKFWNPDWRMTVSKTDMDAAEIKAYLPQYEASALLWLPPAASWDKKSKLLFPGDAGTW